MDLYFPSLTLVVDPDIDKLNRAIFIKDAARISIGIALSEFLVQEAGVNRTQETTKWLTKALREKAPGPIICADIDLLFHPSLDLDPLALFRQISRYTKLVVLWPGNIKDGVLTYATPEHSHFRFWKNLEGIEIKGVADALQ